MQNFIESPRFTIKLIVSLAIYIVFEVTVQRPVLFDWMHAVAGF